MDRRKPVPQSLSSSDSEGSGSSGDDSDSDQERNLPAKAAPQSSSEPSTDEESESESELEPKAANIKQGRQATDSSGSDSDSESDSESPDVAPMSIGHLLSEKRSALTNGSAKKVAAAPPWGQKPQKNEQSAKKGKAEALKRDREEDLNDSVRKRKKANTGYVSSGEQKALLQSSSKEFTHAEKAGKQKPMSVQNGDTDVYREKAVSHDAGKEKAKKSSSNLQTHVRASGLENGSEKKESRNKHEKKGHKQSEADIVKEPMSPQKPRKLEADVVKEPLSPLKPKKSQIWTPKEEIALSSELLICVKSGAEIPIKKNDDFWSQLCGQLNGKLEAEWSKEQLCEKVKRMKTRYNTMLEKMKESEKPYKHRNNNDEVLFNIWSQIWDKANAGKVKDNEEADEDKEEPVKPVVASANVGLTKGGRLTREKKEPDLPRDSEDSDGTEALEGNGVTSTPMESEQTNRLEAATEGLDDGNKTSLDVSLLSRDAGVSIKADGKSADILKLLQDGNRAALLEMQEWSKKMLEEWLSKATSVFENTLKATADKTRHMNVMGLPGVGAFILPPFGGVESFDFQLSSEDQAFRLKLYELQSQELEIYCQKLQLLEKECRLKQEQLKLQLERGT